MRRVKVESVVHDRFALSAKEYHYVRNVLRLPVDTELELFDGRGQAVRARLDGEEVTVLERFEVLSRAVGVIAVATPKGDRADWIVEKCTELGVARLVWTICERSVVIPREEGKRLERYQRLAEAAARQSGRNDVPSIEPPVKLVEAMRELGGGCIAHFGGIPLPQALANGAAPTLLIGPEGGFTDAEVAAAEAAGFVRVSLAATVLRTETAAVAAAAILAASHTRE